MSEKDYLISYYESQVDFLRSELLNNPPRFYRDAIEVDIKNFLMLIKSRVRQLNSGLKKGLCSP